MQIRCFHCGNIYQGNFCPNCGAPAHPPIKTTPPKRKKGLSAWAIVGITLLSIFGFIMICSVIINMMNNIVDSSSDNTATVISKAPERETTTKPADDESKELILEVGDVITSDKMEITINKIEFSYDVLPDNTSSFYTHYAADDGNVYIHIDTDVKNLSKRNLRCDEILTVKADYNDGFTYKGQTIVEDDATGFTYASISSIDQIGRAHV